MGTHAERLGRSARQRRARLVLASAALIALAITVSIGVSSEAPAAGQGAGAGDGRLSKSELMAMGEKVYSKTCASCHQPDGTGIPGIFPPLVAGAAFQAGPFLTGPLEKLGFWVDGEIRLAPVQTHIDVVVNGIPNSRMRGFGIVLNNAEIAAVVTYERNAWGNDSGDVVQPSQVEAAR